MDILTLLIMPSDYNERVVEPEEMRDIYLGISKFKQAVGFIKFDEAYSIFCESYGINFSRIDEGKVFFRDSLLHADHGLNCILYTFKQCRYIILKGDEINLVKLLSNLNKNDVTEDEAIINKESMKILLESMNTEFDTNVLRGLLSELLTKKKHLKLSVLSHIKQLLHFKE